MYGELNGDLHLVELDRGQQCSIGLCLAGNRDLATMSVFVVGYQPGSVAANDGRIRIGDELLEVSSDFDLCRSTLPCSRDGTGSELVTRPDQNRRPEDPVPTLPCSEQTDLRGVYTTHLSAHTVARPVAPTVAPCKHTHATVATATVRATTIAHTILRELSISDFVQSSVQLLH